MNKDLAIGARAPRKRVRSASDKTYRGSARWPSLHLFRLLSSVKALSRAYRSTLEGSKSNSSSMIQIDDSRLSRICPTKARWKCIACRTIGTLAWGKLIGKGLSTKRSASSGTKTTCSRSILRNLRRHQSAFWPSRSSTPNRIATAWPMWPHLPATSAIGASTRLQLAKVQNLSIVWLS